MIQKISKLYCQMEDQEVRDESINLFIHILRNGNKEAQRQVLESLQEDCKYELLKALGVVIDSQIEVLKNICKRMRKKKMDNLFVAVTTEVADAEWERDQADITLVSRRLTRIFRMFQLFCEGHNRDMQALMLIQNPDSPSEDVNFINTAIMLYGLLLKYVEKDITALISQLLSFLVEVIQGPCKSNQEFLLQSKFYEFFKDYIIEFEDSEDPEVREYIKDLIKKTVEVVMSILEGNTNRKEYYIEINKFISIHSLMNLISEEFEECLQKLSLTKMEDPEDIIRFIPSPTFGDDIMELFTTYFFIKYIISNFPEEYGEFFKKLGKEAKRAHQFLNANSLSIELMFNEEVELVYFVAHPASRYLTAEDKQRFIDSARRDTHNSKLADLLRSTPYLMTKMEINYYLQRSSGWLVRALRTLSVGINRVIFGVILIANMLILLIDNYEQEPLLSFRDSHLMYPISRYLILVLAVLRLALYFYIDGPFLLMNGWTKLFALLKTHLEQQVTSPHQKHERASEDPKHAQVLELLSKEIRHVTFEEQKEAIRYCRQKQGYTAPTPAAYYFMRTIQIFLDSGELKYYLYCSFVAALSIYYEANVFIAILLWDFFVRLALDLEPS